MKFIDRISELVPDNFDSFVLKSDGRLKIVFFWGHNCPNCEVAKIHLEENHTEALNLGIDWYHVNTYYHSDLGVRFGLHGIPTFLFFKDSKRLGKVSPFPGWPPLKEAIERALR